VDDANREAGVLAVGAAFEPPVAQAEQLAAVAFDAYVGVLGAGLNAASANRWWGRARNSGSTS